MAKVAKRTWINKNGSKGQSWAIDYHDSSGNRVKKGGFKTKADAEIALAKVITEVNEGNHYSKGKKITFNQAAREYIELHAIVYCKKSTVAGYKSYMKYHLANYFGNIKLVDINSTKIQKFVRNKVEQNLSSQSINHLLKFMSAVYQRMINNELISKNPVSKVKKLKVVHEKFRTLSVEEVKAMLKTAEDFYPEFYPLLFTAIFTGMRRGELAALTWDKINWQTSKIFVEQG